MLCVNSKLSSCLLVLILSRTVVMSLKKLKNSQKMSSWGQQQVEILIKRPSGLNRVEKEACKSIKVSNLTKNSWKFKVMTKKLSSLAVAKDRTVWFIDLINHYHIHFYDLFKVLILYSGLICKVRNWPFLRSDKYNMKVCDIQGILIWGQYRSSIKQKLLYMGQACHKRHNQDIVLFLGIISCWRRMTSWWQNWYYK